MVLNMLLHSIKWWNQGNTLFHEKLLEATFHPSRGRHLELGMGFETPRSA